MVAAFVVSVNEPFFDIKLCKIGSSDDFRLCCSKILSSFWGLARGCRDNRAAVSLDDGMVNDEDEVVGSVAVKNIRY